MSFISGVYPIMFWPSVFDESCFWMSNLGCIIFIFFSFLDNLERLCHEDYIPTEEDVLRVRMKSTGAREYHFVMENMNIRMFDVGGQRSERRKWIHCFEGLSLIRFVLPFK